MRSAHRAMPLTCALVLLTATAQADQDLAGEWTGGPSNMKVAVESWGGDCGPRPKSYSSGGGGTVEMSHDGNQLVIRSGSRKVRTNACWSRNPAMRRQSNSFLSGEWVTKCKTAPDDPREETGTYTLKALTATKLLYRDVSRYNWKLNESSCVATITTTKTYTRKSGAGAGKVAEEPAREEKCTPGAAAKLSLSPRRAVVQLGGEQCFRARLVDAKGCPTSGRVKLSLKREKGLKGRLDGKCFKASDSAAEGEGDFTLLARGGGFEAKASVEVRSMDLSALIAQRIDDAPSEDDAEAQSRAVPEGGDKQGNVAARAVGQDGGSSMGIILGGLGALLLVGAGFWFMRRKPAPVPVVDDDFPAPAPPPAAPAAAQPAQPAAASVAPGGQWICPNCRRGYPTGGGTCTHCPPGQNTLVPYAEFAAKGRETQRPRKCADCGAKWDTPVNFCGECGGRNLVDA